MTSRTFLDCRGDAHSLAAVTPVASELGPALPQPRGRLSEGVVVALRSGRPALLDGLDPVYADSDDDAALALWTLQELSYRGFRGVEETLEWDARVVGLRVALERAWEEELRALCGAPTGDTVPVDVGSTILEMAEADDGPSVAAAVQRHATVDQVRSLLAQRAVYHLKESDPVAWLVPRLEAGPKSALAALQADEYGNGVAGRLHHAMFTAGLQEWGIDATYGATIDEAYVETLQQSTTVTMFGLHRRLRGAAAGHLAAFEATSSIPSSRMAQGLRRLGYEGAMAAYYDEHVEADAVHEQLAARDICGAMVAREPHLWADVHLGVRAVFELEARFATRLLDSWGIAA